MRALDRSFFQKSIPLSAARIRDNKQISRYRTELGHDLLKLDRMPAVRSVWDSNGQEAKALLLRPEVKPNDASTWSPKLSELVKASQVSLLPYNLELDYDYWNYHDIMSAILPEAEQDEFPTGFSIVGHVAHLNLRDQYLPYRHLIATILLDKNPTIRTVINKIDEVGEQNEYRTFTYELLAGDPDMNVEIHQESCKFRFDYSKVYWNSRLNTEHRRLVEKFQPGEAVCDVMAGVGPFAVPAGKKNVFVWANDLNPDSFASLDDAVRRNKRFTERQVDRFVKTFNEDGRTLIRSSAKRLLKTDTHVERFKQLSRLKQPGSTVKPIATLISPKTFNHYILNLPASAITFLSSFIGLYSGLEGLFTPNTDAKLPIIHVHCFSTKSDDNREEEIKICKEISEQIGYEMKPGNVETEAEVQVWDVRDVAPLKRMFCASFRLPGEVAFRVVENEGGT
ncbi:MAG: tRNA(m(1)G37)methyltransferase [Alectoria sarmentosa]|nr:MAG: tRNA(m(1)G37)methyltransferase [Alectoria sarmentosa]